ncbi:hypothetical protein P8R55_08925 [Lactobacillus johnsonii]|uniref:hypothetical protein n=1 Tax=Lactobacillus johnsonii TaxID=33959 RepID=UPI003890D353
MTIKINYFNTLNYSLVLNGLKETSSKYRQAYQAAYPQYKRVSKTLTSSDQLVTLANGKRHLSDAEINILLPIIDLDKQKVESNSLVDAYQTKQYIRLTSINELTKFLKTKKGYSRLTKQIASGDDGLDFKKYIQRTPTKQVAYVRNSKLITVILNLFLLKHNMIFDPQQWDASSVSKVVRSEINEALNFLPVTDIEAIRVIANKYSNSKALNLKDEINNEKNKEDKSLSSLRATYEQFTSLNKL